VVSPWKHYFQTGGLVYDNAFHYKVLKDIVYHDLKGGRTVGYIREYYQKFEKSAVCMKVCFLQITRIDINIVKFPIDI